MKYTYRILVLVSSIAISSCSKNEISPFDKLSDLTKEVISQPTLQELKQGQALLSVSERETLWKTKLNFILENKSEDFTLEQRNIILQIKNLLYRVGMQKLLEHPEIGNNFLEDNLPYFSTHFSKEQLNILIESPYLTKTLLISKINIHTMDDLINPKNYDTETSKRDKETGSCTCLYDLGCPGPQNTCSNTGCTVNNSYEMCGVFGTSSCKGRCSGAEPTLDPDPLGGNPL